ncbi:hypothetical protein JOF53_006746 [Crossiella equi]|uniref:Uncharacterized protein n=1 Tax=Crossiella equi TaxID=130796 RepID=A0ABS5AMR1_9PSEU|nr:hypothetical protein [Crossiella equi]
MFPFSTGLITMRRVLAAVLTGVLAAGSLLACVVPMAGEEACSTTAGYGMCGSC